MKLILRPVGAGDETNISSQDPGSGAHWDKVDEATADEITTMVYTSDAGYQRDLYGIKNHRAETGIIKSVTVYARCAAGDVPTQSSLKIAIKSGATVTESAAFTLTYYTGGWVNYSKEWTLNPTTGHAWSWAEINSLQAGVALREAIASTNAWSGCTQLWIVVDYEPPDPSVGVITVTCQQIGHTLTKDIISSYSKAVSDGKKPTDILTDFLAYQETGTITLGGVSPSLDKVIAIDVHMLDIWEACKLVRDIAGGFIYVDFDPAAPLTRRLWLTDTIGESNGQQIRLGKNLTGIKHLTDYVDFCNRLYPTGAA